ncbi:MAG TPA: hypothetical protein VGE38_08100 [Nocardioides sp.]|uniref:hypothetical protein n=1 Tax=Nocardioides sp. TaxID=35761 RepID=UPI002ED95281
MASQPSGMITRLVHGALPIAIVLASMSALARLAARPLANTDTYFHLRFGAEFLDSWSLRDPGHVTRFESASWVPTQWLPQTLMAQLERWTGLPGVAWWAGAQLVGMVAVLYLTARRSADAVVVAPLVPLALLASTLGLSARPQVISYALVALTVAMWLGARRSARAPWLLVPLTWLWATCHGMWPLAIVIGLVAVAGLAADRQFPRRTVASMAAVPLLSFAAAGLTPVGPAVYGAVLVVTSRAAYFSEWAPPDFTSVPCLVLLGLLGIAAVATLRRPHRATWFEIGLLAVAAGLAVYSLRTVPAAAAMLVPLTARAVQGARPHVPVGPREFVAAALGGVVVLGALAVATPRTAPDPAVQLSATDAQLETVPSGTVVATDSGFGGYAMWRFPDLQITFHGYGDVYTADELERNHMVETLEPGWDRELRRLRATYAVLKRKSTLAYALESAYAWTPVRSPAADDVPGGDPPFVVLRAPAGWLESTAR